ncbi:hypothetical protein KSP40_PGU003817 [Platanthera guangdongensis]|uniref:Uncharacterized protein n=1 Tax=Platanthera guangdongensis TaxID=2320717 RepID=A0ABR2LXK1_9ASPA
MIPNAKKFRFGGIAPELEEKLDKMFSLVVATGENVWMPSSGELPGIFSHANTLSEEAEDHINESNNTQTFANEDLDSTTPRQSSQSGAASKRKRKGKGHEMGTKQIMLAHVEKLFSSSEAIMQHVTAPIIPPSIYLLREAIQELEKYPEIFEDRLLYHFATVHFQTPVNRVTFLSIPEDRRVEWLKTHYLNSHI